MSKNRILVWIIVLLALLNITTIGTIIYNTKKEKKIAETAVVTGIGVNPLNGNFFRNELDFDDEQMNVFRSANQHFRPNSNEIVFRMDSLKHLMFDELNKTTIDTLKINQLTKEFGDLHSLLKDEINQFYLKIKEISTPEQSRKLEEAFAPLFYQDGVNSFEREQGRRLGRGQRNGKGQGQGHRHRYGNQQNDSIIN